MKKSSVIKYELGNAEISFSPETKRYSLPKDDLTQEGLEELVKFAIEVMTDVTGSDFSSLTTSLPAPVAPTPVPKQFQANPDGMNIDLWQYSGGS